MSPLRRRRSAAQTTTEYMLMISVISLALWAVLKTFSDPGGPVQQTGQKLAEDYERTLSNTSGQMKLR